MNTFRTFVYSLAVTCLLVVGVAHSPQAEAAGPPPVVIMETSMGRIIVMLDHKDTPITVQNFLKYVDAGFYDNTMFHRIVAQEEKKKFTGGADVAAINIVQGGGFTYPLRIKRPLFPPIRNEDFRAQSNKKGTIAMARTSAPDSATCQFFFNVTDNEILNPQMEKKQKWAGDDNKEEEHISVHGYCVFGRVIRGMDVVEKMLAVPTGRIRNFQNVPQKPIILKKAYRAK